MYNAARLCSSLTQIIIMELLHGIVNIELHLCDVPHKNNITRCVLIALSDYVTCYRNIMYFANKTPICSTLYLPSVVCCSGVLRINIRTWPCTIFAVLLHQCYDIIITLTICTQYAMCIISLIIICYCITAKSTYVGVVFRR